MAQVFTISDWRGGSREPHSGDETTESSTRLDTQAATNGASAAISSDAASAASEGATIATSASTTTASATTASATTASATTATTNAAGDIVLDRLHVSRGGRPLSSSQSARLAAALREVLLDGKSVEQILDANGKNNPTGVSPLKISVRNDLSDEHSVLTLVNENVPGLMFHITRTLAALKWDIHSAKVSTWAGRAEDAFYVTRRIKAKAENGGTKQQKLGDDEIKTELERLRRRLRRAS